VALFGFLSGRNQGNHLADTLRKLEGRVGELEALQVSREIEWKETKDKLLRHLKRVQELERRSTQDETNPTGYAGMARDAVLRAKFGRNTGGEP